MRDAPEGCTIRNALTALGLALCLLACTNPQSGSLAGPAYSADQAISAVRSFILTSPSDLCRSTGRGSVASAQYVPASGAWEVRFTTSGEDSFLFDETTRQVSASYTFCKR